MLPSPSWSAVRAFSFPLPLLRLGSRRGACVGSAGWLCDSCALPKVLLRPSLSVVIPTARLTIPSLISVMKSIRLSVLDTEEFEELEPPESTRGAEGRLADGSSAIVVIVVVEYQGSSRTKMPDTPEKHVIASRIAEIPGTVSVVLPATTGAGMRGIRQTWGKYAWEIDPSRE